MGYSLLLILLIIFIFIIIAILIGAQGLKHDPYEDLSIDEWNCPECGFLVQVGKKCIYCGYNYNTK